MSRQNRELENMAGAGKTETEVEKAYNDERFDIITNNSRELKCMLRDIEDILNRKMEELLGPVILEHDQRDDEKRPSDNCWSDKIIGEQKKALSFANNIFNRLSKL